MACEFTIPFTGSAVDVIGRAQSTVQRQGGALRGDQQRGTFEISVMGSAIRGTYTVHGQELSIVINTKPFLIPCSTIENFLRSQIR